MRKQSSLNRSFSLGLPVSLPPNFAELVLELEFDLDSSWNPGTVQSLMELYTVSAIQQAIEYYCTNANPKYKLFQARLQTLIMRQDQHSKAAVMHREELPSSLQAKDSSLKISRKQQEPLKEGREKANVDKILDAAELVGTDAGVTLKQGIDAQKTTLDERLQARRAARKALKPKLSECDRGGGLALEDVIEAKLQRLNSKISADKAQELASLRAKFEASMSEFLAMPKSGEA
jgi:hypothetical protein